MKFPILLEDFKVDASMARNFAETAWGRGGTQAKASNTVGAYFFSCSAHGGWVVDGRIFSPQELSNIKNYISPAGMRVVVGTSFDGKKYILGYANPNSMKKKKINYNSLQFRDAQWEDYPLFMFEEDEDWAILEYFTPIRLRGFNSSEHDTIILNTFTRLSTRRK